MYCVVLQCYFLFSNKYDGIEAYFSINMDVLYVDEWDTNQYELLFALVHEQTQ